MRIKTSISGDKELLKNIDVYAKQMDIGVQYAMEKVVDLIVNKASLKAPKDTGKLKASIQGVVKQITVDVFTGHVEAEAKYASYIEFGTSKMKAQPFLEPAIAEGIQILKKEIEEAHKRAARRL